MRIKQAAALTAMLALAACVSTAKPMRNAQGDIVQCKSAGWGWLGAPIALVQQGDCVSKLRKQGYYALNENPNGASIPSSAVKYKSKINFALPAGWANMPISSQLSTAGVRYYATNNTLDAGIMVSAIKSSAVTDMDTYLGSIQSSIKAQASDAAFSATEDLQVGSLSAYRYRYNLTQNGLRLAYVVTVIAGSNEIGVVTAWTTEPNFPAIEPQLLALTDRVGGI
jgi:hypothetical protein